MKHCVSQWTVEERKKGAARTEDRTRRKQAYIITDLIDKMLKTGLMETTH